MSGVELGLRFNLRLSVQDLDFRSRLKSRVLIEV